MKICLEVDHRFQETYIAFEGGKIESGTNSVDWSSGLYILLNRSFCEYKLENRYIDWKRPYCNVALLFCVDIEVQSTIKRYLELVW